MNRIAIIGAGQAAVSVAAKLRQLGHGGSITMFGEEPDYPYERPPLSKAYLLGKVGRERLSLRPSSFYDQHEIVVKTGSRVEAIDLARRQLRVAGVEHSYGSLVFATGSTPVRLSDAVGGSLGGVHVIRTLSDVDAIAPLCKQGVRALIVGGGYIGLEAAAVFRDIGMSVTLIELAPRILQRVAAAETADYFRALHTGRGVELRESTGLVRLSGDAHVREALLSTGEALPVDLVVAGIGARPDDDLAAAAGIVTDRGIVVDDQGRTSDPHVWAAGDCAVFPYDGRKIRLESVQNAVDQGEVVAASIVGAGKPYRPVPWFWSDQYDVKLQIAGLSTGYDSVVTRPGARAGALSHWYFQGARLLAVDAMNDPRSFMCAKRLLERGMNPARAVIADPRTDLKELIAA